MKIAILCFNFLLTAEINEFMNLLPQVFLININIQARIILKASVLHLITSHSYISNIVVSSAQSQTEPTNQGNTRVK